MNFSCATLNEAANAIIFSFQFLQERLAIVRLSCNIHICFIIRSWIAHETQMIAIAKSLFADNFRPWLFGAVSFVALGTALLFPQISHTRSTEVALWWTFLCAISVVNVCAWSLSAEAVRRRKATVDPEVYSFQRWQLILAAAFVLIAA